MPLSKRISGKVGTCLGLNASPQSILPVTGRSMMPYLKPCRDVVLLTPVEPEEIKKGDIIYAYQETEQRHILHRVIRHSPENRSITLMGDSNLKMTEQIPYDNILGRVALIGREGRKSPFPPSKARLWRLLKPIRRILLKIL